MPSRQPNELKENQIRYVAKLAHLSITEEEVKLYSHQLNDILGYMAELAKVDVDKIEPTFHPLPVYNVFREDETKPSLEVENVLENAPQKESSYFKVPRILPTA